MRPLGRNIDSKDFERPGANAIVATDKNEISNGPTLLFGVVFPCETAVIRLRGH
jgi:hypothetical protein